MRRDPVRRPPSFSWETNAGSFSPPLRSRTCSRSSWMPVRLHLSVFPIFFSSDSIIIPWMNSGDFFPLSLHPPTYPYDAGGGEKNRVLYNTSRRRFERFQERER